MSWLYIMIAGFFEVGWIYSLRSTESFTRLFPAILLYGVCGLGAAYFLSLALKSLPLGTTYAVWVGIAIAGSNLIGMVFLGQLLRPAQVACIVLIMVGVIGLKLAEQ